MDWVKQIAPTIATALEGPFGGLAYEVISKVFNIEPTSAKEMLETGKLTSDQLSQIKVAEIQLKEMEERLGLDFENVNVQDRMSARSMQTQVKSNLVPTLAILIISSFIGVTVGTLLGYTKIDTVLAGTLIGYISAKAEQVVAFYFGSSASSQRKDELLHQSIPSK